MTNDELLNDVGTRMAKLDERLRRVFESLGDEAANRPIPPSNWSPYQILDHMMRGNEPYLHAVDSALERAAEGGAKSVIFTWFGKFIAKAAGPASNAPPPKAMQPGPGPFDRKIVDEYLLQTGKLAALIEKARGKDLGARFSNPFVKIFRMTLADAFLIAAEHTERHVRQIEDVVPR